MTSRPRGETLDVVVVGTGVAGLSCALDCQALGLSTLVVTKAQLVSGSTAWAQGGISAVLPASVGGDPEDSVASHVDDTLVAAAGVGAPGPTHTICAGGRRAVDTLRRRGVEFDRVPGGDGPERWSVTREGGHSHRRIVHAGGDATGSAVERALAATARREAVTVLEHHRAVSLVVRDGRVRGLAVAGPRGDRTEIPARAVVLATGGIGACFAASTNPPEATGDGLSLALRAGAALADLEFVQFHPTVLWTGATRGQRALISEAVRGEGAVLLDGAGRRFMVGRHPRAELAPRDVVARAIVEHLREAPGGIGDHVFLDATALDPGWFVRRFPTVTAACRAAGVDPTRDPIPVRPAEHFSCGGVLTDDEGRSTVPGLWAVGEVARTGLHGANRLASNSLLEGAVVGHRAASAIRREQRAGTLAVPSAPLRWEAWTDASDDRPTPTGAAPGRALAEALDRWAGVGRDPAGLSSLSALAAGVAADAAPGSEERSAADVARVIAAAALLRTESRGAHVRLDHLSPDPAQARSRVVAWHDGRLVTAELPAVPGEPAAHVA